MNRSKTGIKKLPKRADLYLWYSPIPERYRNIKWIPNNGTLHVDEMPDSMRKKWEDIAKSGEVQRKYQLLLAKDGNSGTDIKG